MVSIYNYSLRNITKSFGHEGEELNCGSIFYKDTKIGTFEDLDWGGGLQFVIESNHKTAFTDAGKTLLCNYKYGVVPTSDDLDCQYIFKNNESIFLICELLELNEVYEIFQTSPTHIIALVNGSGYTCTDVICPTELELAKLKERTDVAIRFLATSDDDFNFHSSVVNSYK